MAISHSFLLLYSVPLSITDCFPGTLDRHLHYFQFGTLVSNATMNALYVSVHMSIHFCLGTSLGVDLPVHAVCIQSASVDAAHQLSEVFVSLYLPVSMRVPVTPHSLQHLVLHVSPSGDRIRFYFAFLWYLKVCTFSFVTDWIPLLRLLLIFSNEFSVFFSLIYRNSLYILETSSLLVICTQTESETYHLPISTPHSFPHPPPSFA